MPPEKASTTAVWREEGTELAPCCDFCPVRSRYLGATAWLRLGSGAVKSSEAETVDYSALPSVAFPPALLLRAL
jgi:hypothetical protein